MCNIHFRHDRIVSVFRRLAADDRGAMTIVSMFATLLLTATLGMVMNMGRQLDAKMRMQNAADASVLAGGSLMARSMNAMAFCNHLVPDVMSLVAFFREADAKNMRRSSQRVSEILQAWKTVAPQFSSFNPSRLQALASAIPERADLEQAMVDQWMASVEISSTAILPSLEQVLRPNGDASQRGLIPDFQISLYEATQTFVSEAPTKMAQEHLGGNAQGALYGYQGVSPPANIPVANTEGNAAYMSVAVQYRNSLARHYLDELNHDFLWYFDEEAKLSQFNAVWRWFTCAQLNTVLGEHANTNLPWVLDSQPSLVTPLIWDSEQGAWVTADYEVMEHPAVNVSTGDYNDLGAMNFINQYFMFAGIVANPKISELSPRLFVNPFSSQTQAFAQVMIFIPRPRTVYGSENGGDVYAAPVASGNVIVRQRRPIEINLYNQNWQAKLVPATASSIFANNLDFSSAGGGGSAGQGSAGGSLSDSDILQLTNH